MSETKALTNTQFTEGQGEKPGSPSGPLRPSSIVTGKETPG